MARCLWRGGATQRLRDWSVCHHCPSVPCVPCQAPPRPPPPASPSPVPDRCPPGPGPCPGAALPAATTSWSGLLSVALAGGAVTGPQCHPPRWLAGTCCAAWPPVGRACSQRPRVSPGPSLNPPPPAPLPGARAPIPTLAADEDSVLPGGGAGLSMRLLLAFRSKSSSPGTAQQYSGGGRWGQPTACLLPLRCIVTTLPTAFISSPADRHPRVGGLTEAERGPWRHVCLAQNLPSEARDGGCTWARGVGAGVIGKLVRWHLLRAEPGPRRRLPSA